MADTKITALAAIATVDPAADVLPIVDISDTSMAASGTTKKVTTNQILGSGGTATLASATITGAATVGTTLGVTGASTLSSDLTVRSGNKLILNRADNAVSTQLNDQGGGIGFVLNNVNGDGILFKVASNSVYNVGSSYTQTWLDGAGGTRMTLNSTGLGIGATPSYKLHVASSANDLVSIYSLNTNNNASVATSNAFKLGFTSTVGTHFATFKITEDAVNDNGGGLTIDLPFGGVESTKLTITSSGNVGVGVTPSAWGSNSKVVQVGGGSATVSSTGAGSTASRFTHGCYFDNTNWKYQNTSVGPALYEVTGSNAGSTHAWYVAPGGTAGNNITFTQAMTLDASGNLLVGVTSGTLSRITSSFLSSSGNVGIKLIDSQSNNTAKFADFFNGTGTLGSITNNNNAGVLYNVTSDKRLKENISDSESASSLIDSLQVRQFDWKVNNSHQRYGFIAQELVTVVPEAVYQPTNSDEMMAVDYSKLVPMLIKEIQSLRARVQTLEAR